MKTLNLWKIVKNRHLAACITAAALGYSSLAVAETPPDFTIDFPAGWACNVFDLRVEGWLGTQSEKLYKDKFGIVRTIQAGTGGALRFTNLTSQKTFSTKSNGAVSHTTYRKSDGSQTVAVTGHNVLILFPTDIPAGPSTTLYMGEVVYTIDTGGNFFVHSTRGKSIDICAAVS